jgi:hypothetical protein
MYCKNCGKQIPDGSQFCPFCGAKASEPTTTVVPRAPVAKPLLDTVVLIAAGLLCVVALVSLIGALSASGRINGSVNTAVASLSGLAGSAGLDLTDPTASQIIRTAPSVMSGVARFVTFAGIALFLVVAIDWKVTNPARYANL